MRLLLCLLLCAPALAQAPGGLSFAEARELRQRGYRFYEGRWRLPQEIVYLQRRAARRWAAGQPQPAPPPAATPMEAKPGRRPAPAAAETLADLEVEIARARRTIWRHRLRKLPASPAATGILELRLQKVDFLGFDTVPVRFGPGGMATLQLPRTRSISLGTTVGVPLGLGR